MATNAGRPPKDPHHHKGPPGGGGGGTESATSPFSQNFSHHDNLLLPKIPQQLLQQHQQHLQMNQPDRAFSANYFSQMENLMEQMDRMKSLIREKEVDFLKIRHENVVLKQARSFPSYSTTLPSLLEDWNIERRQQKEILQLDNQNHDAPKVIKGLREEVAGLKQKIKGYFAQLNSDARQIRSLNDECRKLREHSQKLEALATSKELLEREELSKQIQELSKKLTEQEKVASEAIRRGEMVERNITTENRQLRGKIHNFEKENTFLKEKTSKLEEVIKERDKEIASLSIYRYNAIHRKLETSCKKCEQRNREEVELKRRQALLDKLPSLQKVELDLQTATSVNVTVPLPAPGEVEEAIRYTIKYSTNPSFVGETTKTILVDTSAADPKARSRAASIVRQESSRSRSASATKVEDSVSKSTLRNRVVTVKGLTSGNIYYFHVYPSLEDVDGSPSESNSILVDEIPPAPPKPTVAAAANPPLITLTIRASKETDGSDPIRFIVYHGNDPEMKESFLVGEVDATIPPQPAPVEVEPTEETDENADEEKEGNVEVEHEPGTFFFHYKNPQTAIPHYFKVAAINAMGQGKFSEISSVAVIDVPPPRPSPPQLKKISSSSVMIVSTCVGNQGSDIECWRILYSKEEKKVDPEHKPTATTTIFTAPPALDKGSLEFLIENLEPGTAYTFAVAAINGIGESEHSEFSEEIVLDEMIPIAEPPQVQVLSPTSLKVTPRKQNAGYTGPKIIAYKIHATTNDTADGKPHTVTVRKGIDEPFAVVDRLDTGSSYFVSLCFIGEESCEGAFSKGVFVPLAAAIPLPNSPLPTPPTRLSDIEGTQDPTDPATSNSNNPTSISNSSSLSLNKLGSKSSLLTLAQKVQNMHEGNPAHHDPVPGAPGSEEATPSPASVGSASTAAAKRVGGGSPTAFIVIKDTGRGSLSPPNSHHASGGTGRAHHGSNSHINAEEGGNGNLLGSSLAKKRTLGGGIASNRSNSNLAQKNTGNAGSNNAKGRGGAR
ncbi:hypothetical protein HDU97_010167 [Phlyctochytrium planicorne]|nr:hypothetical protein HDU97_010167 [Phlyctochytrium planicorne]